MNATALPERTEVAIVGAGPTGLALAITLASAGVDFVVVDRLAEGAKTSRAAVVHAGTLEVLDGLGTAGDLVARGLRMSRFTVREDGRDLLTVPFDGLPTRFPYVLAIPQYETEAVLLARLRALGGDVHRPCEVSSLVQDADGVTLRMSTGQTLRARFAVGADGMHSAVREAAGIGFAGTDYQESFVLADLDMDWAPGRGEVSLTLGGAGLMLIVPFPRGDYRLVATVPEAPAEPDAAFVQRLLDERAPGQARVADAVWASRFRVHHRIADRYRAGRVLLAGDAAHVHSPLGGQGMNTGIQDGHALGRALAEGRVDGYEAERRPVAERVLAFTDRMTRLATTRSATVRGVRGIALPLLGHIAGFRTKLATELAELDRR